MGGGTLRKRKSTTYPSTLRYRLYKHPAHPLTPSPVNGRDPQAENARNRTTASSHTTSHARTQSPLPVNKGGVRSKATKGTTQVSAEIRVPRKKMKRRLPPREEVRRPLVVRDNMDLADVTLLVQEVLERVSETERELRRLRREGSLPETRVRYCKVHIHR